MEEGNKIEIVKMETIPQPLLERKKIIADVKHQGATPTRAELRNYFANKLKIPTDRILIAKIQKKYGLSEVKCIVHAYDTVEAKERFAQDHLLRRHGDLPR
ncbi:MAG: hypothetical protein QXL15_02635, partial [Candidatus Korarchaeota archaeon]